MAVKRLAFRPVKGRAGEVMKEEEHCVMQLASCGLDHMVKVYDVYVESDVR